MLKRQTSADQAFDIFNYIFIGLVVLLTVYPLLYVLLASFSDPVDRVANGVSLLPRPSTLEGYKRVFNDGTIWIGFKNSFTYAVSFALLSTTISLTAAYGLSKRDLVGRNIFMAFFIITLFLNGGLIPTYLLVRGLGMYNTIWALIIPNSVNVINIILARTFITSSISNEIKQAAEIDGCSNFNYFIRILLPLSKPLIAILLLYDIVGQWNSYFDAMIYLDNKLMYPLQLVLRNILVQNDAPPGMIGDIQSINELKRIAELIKYSVIIIASAPLIILYPFLQKYFEKGVMLGSIKG